MKKFLKGIAVALALALVITPCAILFAGCATTIEGEWKIYQITMEGKTFDLGDEVNEDLVLTENFMVLTFDADGTCSTNINGHIADGTWEKTDDGYTIAVGDMIFDAVIEDGKLKMIFPEEEIVYIFQK